MSDHPPVTDRPPQVLDAGSDAEILNQGLHDLLESGLRIHAAPSVEEMLQIAAAQALGLFGAREVVIEVNPYQGFTAMSCSLSARAPTEPHAEGTGAAIVRDLGDSGMKLLGRLTLTPGSGHGSSTELLDHFARMVAGALGVALRLREVTAARDDLLSIVGHDLRNPLGAVSMGASMLRKSLLARADMADELEIVQRIGRCSQRMNRFIEDMLDAARLDAGSLSLSLRPQSARALLVEAAEAFAIPAAAAKITVRVEPTEELSVMADRDRMLQALSNLIDNALKFTPPRGEVVLSAERSAHEAIFSVTDTGAGIPEAQLSVLFGHRVKGVYGERGGFGLGLYVARGIVEAHGGSIRARNDPGRGSALVFTIPRIP